MVTLNELIQQGEDFAQQITFVPSHSNVIRPIIQNLVTFYYEEAS
ncbi:hypothetical protein EZS27_021355 [termite gut metagenome]|uniref:Uncharacterized protein n=1 Tax=termite gut metagenome TaxID=433724 RepID=A0A5J4R7C2_9ZZZZ